jgi:UDP-perosamine 4-acetyltransferase
MDAVKLVVIGGGGHAKVVLETFYLAPGFSVIGVLDARTAGSKLLGTPVLGGDEMLPALKQQGVAAAFVAIGDNQTRQRVADELRRAGFDLPSVIHPTAIVSPSAEIGAGAIVMAGAKIGPEARIGELAVVNTGAIIEHDVIIGRAAHVAPGCCLAGGVSVGDRALIGVGSAVRPQIRIGEDAVIGVGSAVVADISPGITAVGVPARPLAERKR